MSRFEQFMRFAMVGGIATAMQYVILVVLVHAGLAGAVAASSIGFAASSLANYALNRSFTFRSSKAHSDALPRFFVVAMLGLALNAGLMWLFNVLIGIHYLIAQVLATGGTLLWNFALNRIWTFSRTSLAQYPHQREAP